MQERKKNQTQILTELTLGFISVAALLIVASLLPATLINTTLVSTEKGKQFDSGLLNANQTFEHTFDRQVYTTIFV